MFWRLVSPGGSMTQQQPLVSAPIFFPFSQLHLFGFRSRQNVWRLRCDDTEAHHDTYDKYANTPKASVEAPHSGREIGGSFTFRDSASFLRFSSSPRSHTTSTSIKSAAHDSIISGADVSIGALFFSYNSRNSRKNGSHPPKSNKRQKYPLASSGHSPVTPGRRPKATAFDSLSHTPRASLILFADVAA